MSELMMNYTPIVIIGGGAAGLMAALCLAPREVLLLAGGKAGANTASAWAQGGIAAAIGSDDSVALHVADTIAAGAGLCDAAAVARIIAGGPWAIEKLLALGAKFDRDETGSIALGLEAAHQRRRIIHAKDATGAEVMRVLDQAVRATPSVQRVEQALATSLVVEDNIVRGVQFRSPTGFHVVAAHAVIFATGGLGGLFADTTNPRNALGAGLAMAGRAGARLRDMEFVQFHPTALVCGLDPMPLISEALRGEGAVFVDQSATAFMQGGDLAARDIVARAVAAKYAMGDQVYLDARRVLPSQFPGIFAVCCANGINPAKQPIPVRPAAHYHMGGIAVDEQCESSVTGLFACGEVASTGLHGANRLASNSLLEALVTGRDAAAAIAGREFSAARVLPRITEPIDDVSTLSIVRKICTEYLGIMRCDEDLHRAVAQLQSLASHSAAAYVAQIIAVAALQRRESRGGHLRRDFPLIEPDLAYSSISQISASALRFAA